MDYAKLALEIAIIVAGVSASYAVLRQRVHEAHTTAREAKDMHADLRDQVVRLQVGQEWLGKRLDEGMEALRRDVRTLHDKLDRLLDEGCRHCDRRDG